MNPFGHFYTITKHRHMVVRLCFRAGIGWQGLRHDLSKYSPTEFWQGARYYSGKHSPIRDERLHNGLSLAWMHHKGRNRHHYEYWIDMDPETKKYRPVPMPDSYIKEMLCDRIAASKVYLGKKYTDRSPLEYNERERQNWNIHPDTAEKIIFLLNMVADKGEKATLRYLRTHKNIDISKE